MDGPRDVLSPESGRYISFTMCDEKIPGSSSLPYHEAISEDGNKVLVFQSLARSENEPENAAESKLHYQTWSLSDREMPAVLGSTAEILTDVDIKKYIDADSKPISFATNLNFLRIGTQIFCIKESGEYHAINDLDLPRNLCFGDITSRGSLLIVSSRRKLPAITESRGRESAQSDQPLHKLNASPSTSFPNAKADKDLNPMECSRERSESNHALDTSSAKREDSSDKDGSDSDFSSPTDELSEENSAEESWSEGSTEVDELGNPLTSSDESSSTSSELDISSDSESESPQDDAASDTVVNSYAQLYDESDSDGGDVDFDCGSENESYDREDESDLSDQNNHEEDLSFDSDDEDRLARQMAYSREDRKRDAKVEQGILMIYDLAATPPTRIFKLTHQLPIMLYESPPAIHPSKSLVVWPLCGGEVLFADFAAKSYFVRRAKTTTRKTRHVFVKSHFSTCSRYLHIASLEAQETRLSKPEMKAGTKVPLNLSAFITTYRLSNRKTTRSPPILIHRAKVNLGSTTALSPTRMPVEVTWAEKEVYLSSSSDTNQFTLLHVKLFPPAKDITDADYSVISVPKLPILLPKSARFRSVHYYPPQSNSTRALIIIDSCTNAKSENDDKGKKPTLENNATEDKDTIHDPPDTTSPPIGFYVDVEKDLGGWGASDAEVKIEKDKDKGYLKQKMEIFAGEDDCDLEHYFFTRRR